MGKNEETAIIGSELVLNSTINFTHPQTNDQIPLLILYPNQSTTKSFPLLIYASGYFCKPEYPCFMVAVNFLTQIVSHGYVIVTPTHSLAYYEAFQKGGAAILYSIKEYIIENWNDVLQQNNTIIIENTKIGYIGYSDGGGIAIIAGSIDPTDQVSVVAYSPVLTLSGAASNITNTLENYRPSLLAIGGSQDPMATPDKLEFLSTILDYKEDQIYVIFTNCRHEGYLTEPYVPLTLLLTLAFCNKHFKNDTTSFDHYFGEDLFSNDLAQELNLNKTSNDEYSWILFIGGLLFVFVFVLGRHYYIRGKHRRIASRVERKLEKSKKID